MVSEALGTLTARYNEGSQVEAARGYVGAAAAPVEAPLTTVVARSPLVFRGWLWHRGFARVSFGG